MTGGSSRDKKVPSFCECDALRKWLLREIEGVMQKCFWAVPNSNEDLKEEDTYWPNKDLIL